MSNVTIVRPKAAGSRTLEVPLVAPTTSTQARTTRPLGEPTAQAAATASTAPTTPTTSQVSTPAQPAAATPQLGRRTPTRAHRHRRPRQHRGRLLVALRVVLALVATTAVVVAVAHAVQRFG